MDEVLKAIEGATLVDGAAGLAALIFGAVVVFLTAKLKDFLIAKVKKTETKFDDKMLMEAAEELKKRGFIKVATVDQIRKELDLNA